MSDDIWGEAIDKAESRSESDSKVSEVNRRIDSSQLSDLLSTIMEMYGYNVLVMDHNNNEFHNLMYKDFYNFQAGISDLDEKLLDMNDDERFQFFIKQLKNAILSEDYSEHYDWAIDIFEQCLKFYVDPKQYSQNKKLEKMLDQIFNQKPPVYTDIDDDDENTELSSSMESSAIYYKNLLANEHKEYINFLEKILAASHRANSSNIESRIKKVLEEVRAYYAEEKEKSLKNNFIQRGYSEDPKSEMKGSLEKDREYFLGLNFEISMKRVRGISTNLKVIDRPSQDIQADQLIKGMIEKLYERIIEKIEGLNLDGKLIKSSKIYSFCDRIKGYLDSWISIVNTDILDSILQNNKGKPLPVEEALKNENLDWAIGEPLEKQIDHYIKELTKFEK